MPYVGLDIHTKHISICVLGRGLNPGQSRLGSGGCPRTIILSQSPAAPCLVDRSDTIKDCKPTACRQTQRSLHDDPQPLLHQVWDVPPVRPIVTEYRRRRLRCPRCGVTACWQALVGQDGLVGRPITDVP